MDWINIPVSPILKLVGKKDTLECYIQGLPIEQNPKSRYHNYDRFFMQVEAEKYW